MLLLVSLLLGFALQTHGAAPVISGQVGQATLKRDQPSDWRLYELDVNDPDNDTFTCSVVDVTPSTNIFEVTTRPEDNGVYWLYFINHGAGSVTGDSYSLDITCTDNGTDTSNILQVRVDIINNSPPTLNASNSEHVQVNISTTHLPRSVLYVIGYQDPDNDLVTCTASPPTGFSVTADCVIQNEVDLRSVTASSVSITVSVSDGVNAAVTARVTLSFTNDNQAPRVTFPSDLVTANENVMGGATLFTVSVTDDTSTPSVRCGISPAADSSYFVVTVTLPAVSIKLASGKQFDYETGTTTFIITCSADDGYRQTTASTTLLIMDVNEAPYFRSVPVQVTVSEGPVGTVSVLPAYSAVDPDSNSLTYTIVAGGTYSNLFSIRTSDGTLTNQQPLERDNGATNPVIKVMVTDPGGLSATSDVTIYLTDINDNPPAFNQTSYDFKVGLSSAKGDLVGAIGVTDPDAGSNARTDLVMTSDSPSG
ncbi:protocadherin Fat 4-like [Pomacea canaliculata]|uniref:protocadherin Fat 4-like n=1 Tax=Pomacea canaliculata TaxID=400727 RepID=UPI000D728EB1|nr:protocadherin Fat 4-like [Pomacea canaliculata]